ncbi:hypothetical protein ACFL59_09025 [Planctomycetota bacterium]
MTAHDPLKLWTQTIETTHGLMTATEKVVDQAWRQHLDRVETAFKATLDLCRTTSNTAREGRHTLYSAWEQGFDAWRKSCDTKAAKG